MNVSLLPPSSNLIDEIISGITGPGKDYSDTFIVFPGKRPSHFLRRALAQRENGALIPPHVFSMDEFIDHLYKNELGCLRRKLEAIDCIAILYELHKKAEKPLGGESFISPDSFFSIGLKVYDAIEELYIEGVSPQNVRDIEYVQEEVVPEQTRGRLQSLHFFYEGFYRSIEKQEYSTRSYRYRAVSERTGDIDLSRLKKIIIAGFFAFTDSERILFKKILGWENSRFIFQQGPGIEENLLQLGLDLDNTKQVNPDKKEEGAKGPEFHFYQSPDTHGQVFGLSEIIKDNIGKKNQIDQHHVIILPSSETLFPLLHQTLTLINKGEYNISMGYPLQRTPIFGFFNSLMDLINSMEGDRFNIPDYLKFILHPYTKNIYFDGRADITRIMFHTLERIFTEKSKRSTITLAEIEEDKCFFDEVSKEILGTKQSSKIVYGTSILKKHLKTIHEKLINRYRFFKDIHDFATKSIDILTYINNNSTAPLHPFFFPFSEEFVKSLDVIAGSLFKDVSFDELSGYFNFFKQYIMTCRFPFEGTPIKGLQVLGFLETRNLKFDRVFILDANEETLPDVRKDDIFLPYKIRKILKIPTYLDREKLTSYYFDTIVKSAREVHIFFVEKNKKEKSRYVEKLIWEKQKRDKNIDSKEYIKSIRYNVKLNSEGPPPVRKTEKMVQFLKSYFFSATSVDTYLRCSLMFYYKYVLGLNEKKPLKGAIERMEIGNYVHQLLATYFQKRTGFLLKITDINVDEMDKLVDELFKKDFGDDLSGQAYLLSIQIKRRLREFLEKYQIPQIKENEIEITGLESQQKVIVNSFNLKGKIDRIEKRNGNICIIDYKTSAGDKYLKINFKKLDPEDRNNWNDSIGSLQLPFYLNIFKAKTGGPIESMNGSFLSLGELTVDEKIEHPLFQSPEEAINYFPVLQEIIFKLLKEIVNPDVPFGPTKNTKRTCSACAFQNICGT